MFFFRTESQIGQDSLGIPTSGRVGSEYEVCSIRLKWWAPVDFSVVYSHLWVLCFDQLFSISGVEYTLANKMCHRHDELRSRTSFQYVSHTWRAWRYVNCFDRSRCGGWLSMTFGPTSSIPESSICTENFAEVVGLRAVHVLNRLIDAVQISTFGVHES